VNIIGYREFSTKIIVIEFRKYCMQDFCKTLATETS